MLILSTVLYSVQQAHHLASCAQDEMDGPMPPCERLGLCPVASHRGVRTHRHGASCNCQWFPPRCTIPFFPTSGRPVKTRINCLCQCVCCQTFTPRNASVVIFRSNANAQVLVCIAKFKPRSGILPPLRTIPADLSGGAQLMALAITLRRWSPRIQSQSKRPFILIRSR